MEKYLVTLTGYATFFILVPAARVLLASGIILNKSFFKVLAAKIAVFGFVIYAIIPISMNVSAMIEDTYETSIEMTIKEAEDMTDEINEMKDSEGNVLEKFLSKIKDGISGILKKGENLLNRFIEAIAVMMVTSCLIPIVVFLFTLWFIRMLFGIQINVPKNLPKKISSKFPGQKRNSEGV